MACRRLIGRRNVTVYIPNEIFSLQCRYIEMPCYRSFRKIEQQFFFGSYPRAHFKTVVFQYTIIYCRIVGAFTQCKPFASAAYLWLGFNRLMIEAYRVLFLAQDGRIVSQTIPSRANDGDAVVQARQLVGGSQLSFGAETD